jgi:hypothetical protein
MLFHITHTHSGESCPYHKPEVLAETFAKVPANAEESGVKLLGAYTDAAAHSMFFIVDAETAEQVQAFLDPIIDMGEADTRPVVDFAAVIEERMRQG